MKYLVLFISLFPLLGSICSSKEPFSMDNPRDIVAIREKIRIKRGDWSVRQFDKNFERVLDSMPINQKWQTMLQIDQYYDQLFGMEDAFYHLDTTLFDTTLDSIQVLYGGKVNPYSQ